MLQKKSNYSITTHVAVGSNGLILRRPIGSISFICNLLLSFLPKQNFSDGNCSANKNPGDT
jgi:hypothetical protein